MISRTRLVRWIFYVGLLSLGGVFMNGIATRPGSAVVSLLLLAPYIYLKVREGYRAGQQPDSA